MKRLGVLVSHPPLFFSKSPFQESWVPLDKWDKINYIFVGFGQESQQYKERALRKALDCSRPGDALRLLKRVGVDVIKVGGKFPDLEERVREATKKKGD